MSEMIMKLPMCICSFLVFLIIAYALQRPCQKIIKKLPNHKQKLPFFITRVLRTFIILLGIVNSLSVVGIDLKNLIAGLGITGFILGFALKDIISSIISGLIITVNENIRIGEVLTFKDVSGVVLKVDIRHTILQDLKNNKRHFISNSKLLSEHFSIS
jgi:small-conductance mechanosensitive channel